MQFIGHDGAHDPQPPLDGNGQATLHLLMSLLHQDQARYQVRPAEGKQLDQDAIISAVTLGITVSRHLIQTDELATAGPAHITRLLRPCVLSLTASTDHRGPPS